MPTSDTGSADGMTVAFLTDGQEDPMEERFEGDDLAEEDPLLDDLFDDVGEAAWEWATSEDQVLPA